MKFVSKTPTMIPSFDLSVLKCFESIQMEDEPDIIVELIDLYLEDVPRRFELMRSAISAGDRSEVQRQAHTVKGSSGNLGARGISQICDRMEHLTPVGPRFSMPMLMDQLELEFSAVSVMLLQERARRLGLRC